jgi:beta-phosphoglucomutase-like phosphatase (HAD superfamily)
MTRDSAALDAAIRQARHLLFAFDGPVCSVNKARSIGSSVVTALASANLHDALAACHESGRSVTVISANSPIEVHDYLNAHDLSTQVDVVAVSIAEAASTLEAAPVDCLLITSSAADIKAARTAGTPSIGYARTRDDAAHLVDAGATAFVYSVTDVALSLRGHAIPFDA